MNYIIALVALLIGIVSTRYYYQNKIFKIRQAFEQKDNKSYMSGYDAGWTDGNAQGARNQMLEIIEMNRKN